MTMAQVLTTVVLPVAVAVLGWAAVLLRLQVRIASLIHDSQDRDEPQGRAAARQPNRSDLPT